MLPGYDLCCWSLGSRGSRVKEASTACENDKITTLKDSSFLISPKPDEKKITIIITECSLKQTLGIKSTFYFLMRIQLGWVAWQSDQRNKKGWRSRAFAKQNLSKLWHNNNLNMKLSVLLSASEGEREGRLFNLPPSRIWKGQWLGWLTQSRVKIIGRLIQRC